MLSNLSVKTGRFDNTFRNLIISNLIGQLNLVMVKKTIIHLGTVSTDLSNLVPSALGLINPVENFTLVYKLYLQLISLFDISLY